jgi:hypothetical protein
MNDLETLRTDPSAWQSVAFAACQTEERGIFDGNARARLRVLLALQYDRRAADLELIRHLFTNEIIAAENDDFQGFGQAYSLAAFLLARFREPGDAPLFARAKLANFDTACGFPIGFMFVAGGDQTEQVVKATHPDLWDRLQSMVDLAIPRDELEAWWLSISDDYPDCEEDEDLLSRYERALAFDDGERALGYLEQWAEREPDSDSKRSQLKYEYARLGDFARAAQVAAEILARSKSPWDEASALLNLVILHRQAGDFSQSLTTAQQLDATFAVCDDWIGLGLGRMAIHEVFELSLAHPEKAAAIIAFGLADRWFQRSRDLALVGMESAANAARRCGLEEKAKEFAQLADRERKRIEAMMQQA